MGTLADLEDSVTDLDGDPVFVVMGSGLSVNNFFAVAALGDFDKVTISTTLAEPG